MGEHAATSESYDLIAHLYDVDMARSMPFDDLRVYSGATVGAAGRTLEIGCGNGRLLLALVDQGVDIVGVDRSRRMLSELRAKASSRGLRALVCQMDARALAFPACFALVLCPYSIITYMAGEEDASRMFGEIRRVLVPGGRVVVDAFVPRDEIEAPASFTLDYRRPLSGGTLARYKRVTRVAPRLNRIERRYELNDATGFLQVIETVETIRLFTPQELLDAVAKSSFVVEQTWWDYGAVPRPRDPRFFTVLARA